MHRAGDLLDYNCQAVQFVKDPLFGIKLDLLNRTIQRHSIGIQVIILEKQQSGIGPIGKLKMVRDQHFKQRGHCCRCRLCGGDVKVAAILVPGDVINGISFTVIPLVEEIGKILPGDIFEPIPEVVAGGHRIGIFFNKGLQHLKENIVILQFKPDHMQQQGPFVVRKPAVENSPDVAQFLFRDIYAAAGLAFHMVMAYFQP